MNAARLAPSNTSSAGPVSAATALYVVVPTVKNSPAAGCAVKVSVPVAASSSVGLPLSSQKRTRTCVEERTGIVSGVRVCP